MSGVKFTVAGQVVRQVLAAMERGGYARMAPAADRAPGRSRPEPSKWPRASSLHALLERSPDTARELIRRLASSEAACTPDDVLLRRTGWGLDPGAAEALTELVQNALSRPDRQHDLS